MSIPNIVMKNTFFLTFFIFVRDRAVSARMALLHDHGGQFRGFGGSAADARGGISLS